MFKQVLSLIHGTISQWLKINKCISSRWNNASVKLYALHVYLLVEEPPNFLIDIVIKKSKILYNTISKILLYSYAD